MSNTPHLSWTDLSGVRSCPIDGWRKTLQILQTAFCPYNVCVGQPSTHVLPRSKEESKRTSFHSLFLHRSIGHDLTPGMSMDMTQIGCTGQPSNSVVGHWTNIKLGRQNGRPLHWPQCSCVSLKIKLWKLLLRAAVCMPSSIVQWCARISHF